MHSAWVMRRTLLRGISPIGSYSGPQGIDRDDTSGIPVCKTIYFCLMGAIVFPGKYEVCYVLEPQLIMIAEATARAAFLEWSRVIEQWCHCQWRAGSSMSPRGLLVTWRSLLESAEEGHALWPEQDCCAEIDFLIF